MPFNGAMICVSAQDKAAWLKSKSDGWKADKKVKKKFDSVLKPGI